MAGNQNQRLRPTRDTKISELLNAYPEMIDILARYNRHFELLRRPTLRKIMTPLVTIEKAARTAQVDPDDMLAEIYRAIGEPFSRGQDRPRAASAPETGPMPEEIRNISDEHRIVLDVRDDVRAGEEPYHRIMQAVTALKEDQVLQLCNIFEPVPLYDLLAKRGLAHWTERRGPEEWWVTFYRPTEPAGRGQYSPAPGSPSGPQLPPDHIAVVDARGLEPPQPMARILAALPQIAAGRTILALTDRRPLLLYEKLQDRGFRYATQESGHGWFETRIWK
jgi:uncharacterized protein (DUF2249 family)